MSVRTLLAVVALCTTIFSTGCSTDKKPNTQPKNPGEQVEKNARKTAEAVREWSAQTKRQLIRDTSRQIKALQNRIEDLEHAAAQKGARARRKWDNEMEPRLESQIQKARDQLAQLKKSSKNTWERTRAGIKQALTDLRAAVTGAEKGTESK